MADIIEFETDRLRLRQWRDNDKVEFARMNGDPEVMEYFPATLDKAQSNALVDTLQSKIAAQGWGFWALEVKGQDQLAGFTGLNEPDYAVPVSPCIEIGWRLQKKFWGKGYATEAATAVLHVAFSTLHFPSVYSFTATINQRSISVMKRLGMKDTGQNFLHPRVPAESSLQEHVLYKIDREIFLTD